MSSFIDKMYNFILSENMLADADGIVAGVSGGADSVAMLVGLCELSEKLSLKKDKIIAVHINHMIRGEEADGDQKFVEALCEKLGICCKVFAKNIPELAKEKGLTLEEAGRLYRYQCFEEVSKAEGIQNIAVAHNQNDVAETLLFNILRGSGLNGLAAIKAKRDNIIRPILFASRNQIEEYLNDKKQDYVTDSTNLTLDYDRNKIRHIILPTMMEINDKAIEHLEALAKEAEDSYQYVHKSAKEFLDEYIDEGNTSSLKVDLDKLQSADDLMCGHIIHEAIGVVAGKKKDITRKHVDSVKQLLTQGTGKQLSLPYELIARISYNQLIIEKTGKDTEDLCVDISKPGEYKLPDKGKLIVTMTDTVDAEQLLKNTYTKYFDYDKIMGTLCIRKPMQGDYIRIDGKGSTKKLSKLFVDMKIDRKVRESIPVIAVMDEVLWVIGVRYNEAYRVDDNTKNILCVEYVGGN